MFSWWWLAAAGATEEVVVVAEPEDVDPTAPTTTVEGDALRAAPQATTLEAIAAQVPGLHVTTTATGLLGVGPGSTGGMAMRGLGGSPTTQVLVVEDGVPQVMGLFGHPLPDLLTPGLVDRVTVTPGGDSVVHGTNAMGAVVDVRSRWREDEGVEGRVGVQGGSLDTLAARGHLLARSGPHDFALSVDALTTEGHRPGAGGQRLSGAMAGRVQLRPTTHLTLRVRAAELRGADPGPLSNPHPWHRYEATRTGASARLDAGQGPVDVAVTTWVQTGQHRLHDGFASTDVYAGGNARVRWRSRWVTLRGGLWADVLDGAIGDRIDDTRERVPSQVQMGPWVDATFRPHPAVDVVTGIRMVAGVGPVATPWKAGLAWRAWDGGQAQFRHADNLRQPTLQERFLPFPVATPDLRAERSSTTEVAIQQAGGWGRLRVGGFVTHGRDLIRSFGPFPYTVTLNLDRATFPGAELSLQGQVHPTLSVDLGATWTAVGRYTQQNPDRMVRLGLRWAHGSVFAHAFAQWVGGLYMANYQRDPLRDVWGVDATVGVDVPHLPVRLRLDGRQLAGPMAWVEGYPTAAWVVLGGVEVDWGRRPGGR